MSLGKEGDANGSHAVSTLSEIHSSAQFILNRDGNTGDEKDEEEDENGDVKNDANRTGSHFNGNRKSL